MGSPDLVTKTVNLLWKFQRGPGPSAFGEQLAMNLREKRTRSST